MLIAKTELLNRGSGSLKGAEKGQHKKTVAYLFSEHAVEVRN